MEFKDIVSQRYATKKFDGRKVPQDKLDQILDMARLAPSAINLQPWKIKVVADEQTKQALLPLSWGQQQVSTCSHLLVFCANTDFESLGQKILGGMRKAQVPAETIGHLEALIKGFSGSTAQQRLCEAQKNTFLAALTAMYAAKSLGIDSCPMQGFDAAGYAQVLKLPDNLVPTLIVPLGYPADRPMPKTRFPKGEIVF